MWMILLDTRFVPLIVGNSLVKFKYFSFKQKNTKIWSSIHVIW